MIKPWIVRLLSALSLLALLISQAGCSKEKAEALKTAAQAFQQQAEASLEKLQDLFIKDIAYAPETKEEVITAVVKDLDAKNLDQEAVENIVARIKIDTGADTQRYEAKITELRQTYVEFGAMFENLPRGSFLASGSVKRSERLAVKLSLNLTHFARYIREHPFRLNARLQAVRRQHDEAMNSANQSLKEERMKAIAEELVSIRNDTDVANQAAIAECFKGAELGLKVAQLIRDFNKLSTLDVLQLLKDALPSISAVTGKSTDSLLKQLETIELTIKTEPVWSDVAAEVEKLWLNDSKATN